MDDNWSYPRPKVISVFNVWETWDRNGRKPHYPSYEVVTDLVGSALSLEGAERLVRELVENEDDFPPYRRHSIRVTEQPIGMIYPLFNMSEYVYDREGRLLDKRTNPTGRWLGRTAEEIRFLKGDLCEVLIGDKVVLGVVQTVPPTPEQAARMQLDDSDDCYTVLTQEGEYDNHIDSLMVFPPRFKIAARTERKLRRYYAEEQTLWTRLRIASTTAVSQLRALMDELGWEADIRFPRWCEDAIGLEIRGVPGFPDVLRVDLDQKKAHEHMDRIRIMFRRLAGQHPAGRGYRLKRIMDCHKNPMAPETWKI